MRDGWQLFRHNLKLHLAHFAGRAGHSMLPMAMWAGPREDAWRRLTSAFGFAGDPHAGDRVVAGGDAPPQSGTVVEAKDWRLSLLLDEPAPGTAFLACEGMGDQVGVSVWSYLYGDDAESIITRDEPRWNVWLAADAQ
jgi:hypothetical protein